MILFEMPGYSKVNKRYNIRASETLFFVTVNKGTNRQITKIFNTSNNNARKKKRVRYRIFQELDGCLHF